MSKTVLGGTSTPGKDRRIHRLRLREVWQAGPSVGRCHRDRACMRHIVTDMTWLASSIPVTLKRKAQSSTASDLISSIHFDLRLRIVKTPCRPNRHFESTVKMFDNSRPTSCRVRGPWISMYDKLAYLL